MTGITGYFLGQVSQEKKIDTGKKTLPELHNPQATYDDVWLTWVISQATYDDVCLTWVLP